jgi:hypothetical protein
MGLKNNDETVESTSIIDAAKAPQPQEGDGRSRRTTTTKERAKHPTTTKMKERVTSNERQS